MGGAKSFFVASEMYEFLLISVTEEAKKLRKMTNSLTEEVALPVARMVPTAVSVVVGLGHTTAS